MSLRQSSCQRQRSLAVIQAEIPRKEGLTPAIGGFSRALDFVPKNCANVKVIGTLIHFSLRTGILQFD
jgi:hypothetical protein